MGGMPQRSRQQMDEQMQLKGTRLQNARLVSSYLYYRESCPEFLQTLISGRMVMATRTRFGQT
jgi:uncharacterized protein YaaR (DUF327 family)